LVTIDDRKAGEGSLSLYADGVNVHSMMMARTEFRKIVEGSLRSGFQHSFLAKGRLLYTHDESIAGLCERLNAPGQRDIQIQLLNAGSNALAPLYKAHKWLRTRGDLDYTALWILYAATSLAKIEVLSAGLLVDREVLPQALQLNPSFFKTVYSELLNTKKTLKNVTAALTAADEYLAARVPQLFGTVLEYLTEAGEPRSATEIDDYFTRNLGVHGASCACEYLADQGLIGKTGLPVRLTKKSNVQVEELAFFDKAKAEEDERDGW